MRKALTDVLVRNLARPATGRLDVTDDRCPGLVLRVTPSDAKSWCFRFRDPRSRKTTRATIGRYPDVSLAQARERATELRREVASGSNPIERKRREHKEATSKAFSTLAERYLTEHARRFKRSWETDERNLRLHVLPAWKDRRYDEIERRDVIALSERLIAQGKPILANRVQALVSSMYSFAVDADLVRANPCTRLRKRSQERARRRVLSDGELRLFWERIIASPVSKQLGLALRLILLTGVRAGEMAGARREEFRHLDDTERAAWVIPPERTKNGRGHFVPLSELARVAVSEILSDLGAAEERLLPSPLVANATITPHALAVAMSRFAKSLSRSGVEASWHAAPPTPHDLRRTLATRAAELGVPGEDVRALLNHSRRDITGRHYDLYDRAREKRHALELWSCALSADLGLANRPASFDGPAVPELSAADKRTGALQAA